MYKEAGAQFKKKGIVQMESETEMEKLSHKFWEIKPRASK